VASPAVDQLDKSEITKITNRLETNQQGLAEPFDRWGKGHRLIRK
jgi:exonuclease VII small subunit